MPQDLKWLISSGQPTDSAMRMTSSTLSTRPSPSPRMCAVSGRPYFPSGRSIAAYSEKLLKHSGMYMMPQETPGAPSESASSTQASACSSSAAVNGVREKPLRLMRTAPVPIIAAKFSGSAAFSSRRTYSRYVSGAPAGTGPSTAAENARCSAQNGAAHGVSEMPQLPETDVVMPCRSSASALQPRSGCTSAWRWMSMKPGQSILPAASSTAAPGGAGRPGPTASIVSPCTSTSPKNGAPPPPS